MVKIVYNKLLGTWYVVRGPHHTPVSGAFPTKAAAKAWLDSRNRNKERVMYKGVNRFMNRMAIKEAKKKKPGVGWGLRKGKPLHQKIAEPVWIAGRAGLITAGEEAARLQAREDARKIVRKRRPEPRPKFKHPARPAKGD